MVWTSGVAGLLLMNAMGPEMTSKRIWRPGNAPPAGPRAETVAVPVCPEHRLAPQVLALGAKANAFNSGAGRTVTETMTVRPSPSWTVTATVVSALTAFARSRTLWSATDWLTGRTVGLLEKAV